MRRPYNHAVLNSLKATYVGLEADKPAILKEGETYFATDTYRLYIGGADNQNPFSTLGFPYHKLVTSWDSSGDLAFRFMVDGANGDDANNGLKWSTAKKTIQGAIDELPLDLQGHVAWIFVKPGTYSENIIVTNGNGYMNLSWFGETYLLDDHDIKPWARGGETVTTTNDPIIITGDPTNHDRLFLNNGTVKLEFSAFDLAQSAWAAGRNFAERWQFSPLAGNTNQIFVLWNGWVDGFGLRFDLNESRTGVEIGAADCRLISPAFYGGTGDASTSTSEWRGAIMSNAAAGRWIEFGKYGGGFGWHASFLPKQDDGCYFEDINQVASLRGPSFVNLYNPTFAQVSGTYTKGIIRLHTDAENHKIEYDSDEFTLNNLSTGKMYIKDLKDSSVIQYITANIQDPLPTADPGVAGVLWNDTNVVKVSAGP